MVEDTGTNVVDGCIRRFNMRVVPDVLGVLGAPRGGYRTDIIGIDVDGRRILARGITIFITRFEVIAEVLGHIRY